MLFNFNLDAITAEVTVLGIGLLLVLVLSGFIRGFAFAASSKIVPAHRKAYMSMWATIFTAVGRGAGGIVGPMLQPNSFFPVAVSLFGVTSLISVASHAHMKPCDKAS